MTFLTQELCTKTGTNQLLFPPPWLQPNPMQKFHPAPFPVVLGREHSWKHRGKKRKAAQLVLAVDFPNNPSCLHAGQRKISCIFNGMSDSAWLGTVPASSGGLPGATRPFQQPWICLPTPTGVMSPLLLVGKQEHPEQLSEVRHSNAYLST